MLFVILGACSSTGGRGVSPAEGDNLGSGSRWVSPAQGARFWVFRRCDIGFKK